MRIGVLVAVVCLGWPVVGAAQLTSRGHVGLEGRAFVPDDDDRTEDFGLGLNARVQLDHRHRPWRETLRVFARVDALDQERNIVFLEEAYVGFRSKWVSARIGAQMFDWTATEAFHPADVVNSRNLDSNLENAEKMGEPSVFVGFRFFRGEIGAYYMPLRLAPNLPGSSSRLSFVPPGRALGSAVWVNRDGSIDDDPISHQWAVRISQTMGPVDLALQVMQHNDRSQPTVRFDRDRLEGRPLYHQVTHFGLTGVWAEEFLTVKVEGAYRMFGDVDPSERMVAGAVQVAPGAPAFDVGPGAPEDHLQVAVGFESGWEWENGHDSTWLLEGQAVLLVDEEERKRLSPFQADVLIGYRHAFNDIDGKELLVGVIMDVEDWPQLLGNVSYRQRLSDTWSLEAGARLFFAPVEDGEQPVGIQALRKASSVSLNVLRNF